MSKFIIQSYEQFARDYNWEDTLTSSIATPADALYAAETIVSELAGEIPAEDCEELRDMLVESAAREYALRMRESVESALLVHGRGAATLPALSHADSLDRDDYLRFGPHIAALLGSNRGLDHDEWLVLLPAQLGLDSELDADSSVIAYREVQP